MHPRLLLSAVLLLATLAFVPDVVAAWRPAQLKSFSLEELANLEVVSVSRRSEELWRASAAIDVVTGERIRRAGVFELPDALRLATGLDVAQANGRTWAINARGFVNTTANKLEVLMDGRSLYSGLFSGVFWDAQQALLADLARIEVIRGPGAVQWGANAVNGVINIISRPAAETQGALVEVTAGNATRFQGAVRYGGALPDGHFRVYALLRDQAPLRRAGGGDAGDGRRIGQIGTRIDWKLADTAVLTLQGDAYDGDASQPVGGAITVRGANLLGRWTAGGEAAPASLQFYYDRVERRIPGVFGERRDTFDAQGQREFTAGRHTWLVGARARVLVDRIDNSASLAFLPANTTTRLFSVFAQDVVDFSDPRWRVVLGTTLEHNSYTGLEVQPTVRATFAAGERSLWWAALSRAVRTPSRIDTQFFTRTPAGADALIGNPDFDSEELQAAEVGLRWRTEGRWFVDLSLFHHRYDNLRSQEPVGGAPVPFTLRNLLNARSDGAELTLTWQPDAWFNGKLGWRELEKSFSFDAGSRDATRGAAEGNDPRRLGFLQASFELPRECRLDVVLRYAGARPAPLVPAVLEADVRLAAPFGRHWEWALSGRNLLDRAHREFGPATSASPEVRRSVQLTLTWRN